MSTRDKARNIAQAATGKAAWDSYAQTAGRAREGQPGQAEKLTDTAHKQRAG